MEKTTKDTYKYFLGKALKYKKTFFLGFIGITIGITFLGLFFGIVYKNIIDLMVSSTDKVSVLPDIFTWVIYFGLAYILGNMGWRTAGYSIVYLQSNVMRDIENDCFRNLQNQSHSFFANNFSGALVNKVNRLTRSFERLHDKMMWDLFHLLMRVSIAIFILFFISKLIAVVLLIWSMIFILFVLFTYRWKFKYDLDSAKKDSLVTAELADSMTNIINTKVFSKHKFEISRFFDVSKTRFKARKKTWTIGQTLMVFQGLITLIGEVGILYLTIKLWLIGAISVGDIVLIQTYLSMVMFGLWFLGDSIREIFEATADAKEMMVILELDPELKDPDEPQKCKIKAGNIEFNNVEFKYEEKKIFENFNLNIKSKESIGLVGESGAGKSTITKMLLRFADIEKGEILIDGQDIRNLKQEDLREKISYVPQDSILFHRTIFENIAYSNPYTTKEEVIRVAKAANIHDFIDSLPDKYDTYVGERGIKLSGGERQRVAIARAMLKNAPIIMLDEATSSLDSNSEKLIQEALSNLIRNKTTIVIAHRLSTIKMLDRIIVIDKGKIVEEGSHKVLLGKKGKYHELWEHQTSNI